LPELPPWKDTSQWMVTESSLTQMKQWYPIRFDMVWLGLTGWDMLRYVEMFNVYNFFSAHCFFILSNDSGSWVKTWRLSQPGRVNGRCVGVPFDKVLGVGTSGSNRVYIYIIL
jgi:hypothetical protein